MVQFISEHLFERDLVLFRHPGHPDGREKVSPGVVERKRATPRLLISGRATRLLSVRRRLCALGRPAAVFHRDEHPIERHRHSHGFILHGLLVPKLPLELLAVEPLEGLEADLFHQEA